MGNTTNKNPEQQPARRESEMTNRTVNTQRYLQPTEIVHESCCGISSRHPVKEAWKQNFESYCTELRGLFKWVEYLMVAYDKYSILPRGEYLKELNLIRYEKLEKSLVDDRLYYESKVINLEEAIEKSVFFPAELFKSFGGDKPIQMETHTTASFGKNNKRRSVLLAQGQAKRQARGQKHNISFLQESMKELFQPKQARKLEGDAAQELAIFVRFSECIERQLTDEQHFLTILKRTFVIYLSEEYSEADPSTEQLLTKDLKQFIRLFQELIWDYYRLEMLLELFPLCKLINEESLTNLVTSVMFKDPEVNRVVLRCYEQVCRIQQTKLIKLVDSHQNISPSDMKVEDEYCLNKRTIDWYMEQLSAQSMVENMAVSAIMDFTPYESCIVKLKQLEQTQTPIGKLKVIVGCAQRIEGCISEFYQLNSLPAKPSVVDADQILSIFTYIIVCSRIKRIYTHLKVIENFASKQQLKSMTGYYYNVILSAVTHLQNIQRGYERDEEDAI